MIPVAVGPAYHQLRDTLLSGNTAERSCNIDVGSSDQFPTQFLDQSKVTGQLLTVHFRHGMADIDMHRNPWRIQIERDASCRSDQSLRQGAMAYRNHQALARLPGFSTTGGQKQLVQIAVDFLGRHTKSDLPQGGKSIFLEEIGGC